MNELNYIIIAVPVLIAVVLVFVITKGKNKEIKIIYANPNSTKGKIQRWTVASLALLLFVSVIIYTRL